MSPATPIFVLKIFKIKLSINGFIMRTWSYFEIICPFKYKVLSRPLRLFHVPSIIFPNFHTHNRDAHFLDQILKHIIVGPHMILRHQFICNLPKRVFVLFCVHTIVDGIDAILCSYLSQINLNMIARPVCIAVWIEKIDAHNQAFDSLRLVFREIKKKLTPSVIHNKI